MKVQTSYSNDEHKLSDPLMRDGVFDKLSQDKNWLVRQSIAQNTSTPESILERLANDENLQVVAAAKRNVVG